MEQIQRIVEHKKFQYYLNKISQLEQGRPYCLHPIEHSLDVARIAYILWLEEGIKNCQVSLPNFHIKKCIYAAALLHDIGRFRQYLYGERHPEASYLLAQSILDDTGFETPEQEIILDAIRFHNRNESEHAMTRIFQKADRYSRTCWKCREQSSCYKLSEMDTRHGIIY
ncbi:hypothetical protein BHU72_11280 [Desulfuribacillus stibiiarsenatis]|uniref:HD/PDEase domain-containing protein n=1 Tax=Desulfuribacillus stibiiarsenatis TaxID=1390249 RepID=A0A1E5L2K8_9FIRM|nr:HD domain-containing protein [Desulfuribacillus stibiiarsenatis]OEH84375.1 hypothetical protein BHU72_11280 [Desulfuribacillus stibiiarsenatis]